MIGAKEDYFVTLSRYRVLITSLAILFSIFLFILFFSCNDSSKKYEYIIKDKAFVNGFNHTENSNIVQLSNGFTYYKLGNKETNAIPVVLVHGFSVPSYIWDPTFELLSDKGYFVISLDLYGRGFSENVDEIYTDELFANQVIELLQKLPKVSTRPWSKIKKLMIFLNCSPSSLRSSPDHHLRGS